MAAADCSPRKEIPMLPIRVLAVLLLLGVAACGSTQGNMTVATSPLIDQPSPPFPYNSLICP